ncbi:MAG: peptidoglycan DD-metalloendopeptidase family protein [Spirochaetes bacterium]|nr:peptidoglycan DD-metalloendopeptidase family protein [Spirochaetota bacterium]
MNIMVTLAGLFPVVAGTLLRIQLGWIFFLPLLSWLRRKVPQGLAIRLISLMLLVLPLLMAAGCLYTYKLGSPLLAIAKQSTDIAVGSIATPLEPEHIVPTNVLAATSPSAEENQPISGQLLGSEAAAAAQAALKTVEANKLSTKLRLTIPLFPSALLTLLWLAGSLFALVSCILQRLGLGRKLLRYPGVNPDIWGQLIEELQRQDRIPGRVRFASDSGNAGTAYVSGLLRPCIVLPEAAAEWTECQRESVLLHELQHIHNHDLWRCFAMELVAAFTWCLFGRRTLEQVCLQIQEERCDLHVVKNGRDYLAYAQLLLELSHIVSPLRLTGAQGTIGRGSIERRINLIIKHTQNPVPPALAVWKRFVLVSGLALPLALLAGAPNVLASSLSSPDQSAAAFSVVQTADSAVVKLPSSIAASRSESAEAGQTTGSKAHTPRIWLAAAGSELDETIQLWSYSGPSKSQTDSQGNEILVDTGYWAEYPLHQLPLGYPVEKQLGQVSMGFGRNQNPIYGTEYVHRGIDISTFRSGDAVLATMDAEVIACYYEMDLGNYVILRRGRILVLYAHLKSFNIKVGDTVQTGQTIAYIGNTGLSTGPHLHYGVHIVESEAVLDNLGSDPASAIRSRTTCVDALPLLRKGGWTGEDKSAERQNY